MWTVLGMLEGGALSIRTDLTRIFRAGAEDDE